MNEKVKDLMHKGLITCSPATLLGHVAKLLDVHNIHSLIVAETNDRPLGIISDFDLLAGEWLSVDDESLSTMRHLTARDLMTTPIETVEADTRVSEAAETMGKKDIHRMLVIDADKPVGVLSVTDLVAGIAAQEPMRRKTVRDVTSRTFLVCREDNTVISAARTMTQAGWRSIVVVDAHGKLKGILTGHQLISLAGRQVDENMTVKDFMNRKLITVDINAGLQEAADLLIQHHRHRAIVIDKDDPNSFPLGVISSFDIVAEMARTDSIWQRK